MIRFLAFVFIVLISGSLFAGYSYDPGDIINAVKRSSLISELYLERFKKMEQAKTYSELEKMEFSERFYHITRSNNSKILDVFLNAEQIQSFPIKTRFGENQLDLFRLFGSAIVRFEDLIELGDVKWGFAFSSTGLRYGMNAAIALNNAGSVPLNSLEPGVSPTGFSTNEYAYSQIFDDLLVFTNFLKPFGYLQTGVFINKFIDPGYDGLLNTKDDVTNELYRRFYFNINLLDVVDLKSNYNSKENKSEYLETKIDITNILQVTDVILKSYHLPDINIGFSYLDRTFMGKKSLYLMNIEGIWNYYNMISFKAGSSIFLYGRLENEKEYVLKSMFFETAFNFELRKLGKAEPYYDKELSLFYYYILFGVSYLVDQRMIEFGSDEVSSMGSMVGLKLSLLTSSVNAALQLKLYSTYAPKIVNLVEAYGRLFTEISLQIGF